MSFDTPLSICGPLRGPKQMLAEQEYGGHTSIHDDGEEVGDAVRFYTFASGSRAKRAAKRFASTSSASFARATRFEALAALMSSAAASSLVLRPNRRQVSSAPFLRLLRQRSRPRAVSSSRQSSATSRPRSRSSRACTRSATPSPSTSACWLSPSMQREGGTVPGNSEGGVTRSCCPHVFARAGQQDLRVAQRIVRRLCEIVMSVPSLLRGR